MAPPVLTGIRPSLWARCPRAAAYQGQGQPEADLPPETREWFFRGHVFEEIVVRQIQAKHGKDNVERQVTIPIPGIGEGHADAFLRDTRTLVEVKSTVAPFPNSPIFESGVKQLQLYLAHHGEAEQGALYMLNPNTMRPADVYTVRLTDDDAGKIAEERQEIVEAAAGTGPMPNRVCQRPSQARGRFCPFAAVCFPDWQPDRAVEVTSPDALEAAARLHAIKEEKRQHAAAIKALEEGEREAQALLAEHVEPGEAIVGAFSVKRTHVVLGPRFSERAAKAAGFPVETLAEFFTGGSEHDRWTVAMADAAGDVDFGEAPF